MFLIPLQQALIFLLRQSHERAVLRCRDTLDVNGIVEAAQVFVGLADAVVLRVVAVLNVGHTPRLVADELEGTRALAVLAALKRHIVVLHGLAPTGGELLRCSRVDARLATFLLDEHVVQAVA